MAKGVTVPGRKSGAGGAGMAGNSGEGMSCHVLPKRQDIDIRHRDPV